MSLATQAAEAHRAGRLVEAARHYHDMLQAQPNDFDALHMLGVLLSQQGQQVLAIIPDYPEAHFNRANTLVALTRFKEAGSDFARAVALRPDYVDAHYNRGLVLAKLNHHTQALRCFDVAIDWTPRMTAAAAMRSASCVGTRKDFAATNRH